MVRTTLALWLLGFLAGVAPLFANPYQGIRYEETTGKVYQHLSGELALAASTATWSTYTITMNGTGGVITASSIATSTMTARSVSVSSAATSTDSLCLAGAHTSLPTTGYNRGCFLFLTAEPTKIFVSSETVVSTRSWVGK